MNNMHTNKKRFLRSLRAPSAVASGFTLVELLVAMGVFLVIGAAAVTVVTKQTPLFTTQQNQAASNVNLRNAIAQMQIDVVNAGSGFAVPGQPAMIPMGVAIKNTLGGACYDAATSTYGATCFDELHIISVNTAVPPSTPISATSCVSETSSTLFVSPLDPAAPPDPLAAQFHDGDQILVINMNGPNIDHVAMVGLSKDGAISGGKVQLQHNPQGTVETNSLFNLSPEAQANQLGYNYCKPTSYVFKLNPEIVYGVDTTDPKNPVLYRQEGNGPKNVIAEQIVGFKVGAMIWNSPDDKYYFYAPNPPTDLTNPGYNSDWGSIRSVKISVIGRTAPEPNNKFRNKFDGGPYKIQPVSIVINPRNLSMHD
jgi:prepilin-type N-terminal cleavage/methylation domain-containing protein